MSGKIEIFGTTDVGQQRDHNEDNFVICQDVAQQQWQFKKDQIIDLGEMGAMLMVADGMGGTNAGEVASDIAQKTIKEIFNELTTLPASVPHFLKEVIGRAHKAIVKHAKENPACQGMGTTAIIAWLIGNDLHIAWSGDSRCYIYRPDEGMIQANEDHSMVWEMVKAGTISKEEAWDHPESNIITQSLGDPYNSPKPDTVQHLIQSGDRIIVCSDGLNAMLRDEEIEQVAAAKMSTADTCRHLVDKSNLAGGHDNITVLMLEAKELPPLPAQHASASLKSGMTTTEITDAKLGRRNLLIGVLALIIIALLGFMFNDSLGNMFFGAPTVDSTQIRNDAIEGDLPQIDTSSNSNTDNARSPVNPNRPKKSDGLGSGNTTNPITDTTKPDTANNSSPKDTLKTHAGKSPLELLKERDSLDKLNGTSITRLPPTRQEFEKVFAQIVDMKVKSASLINCMMVDNLSSITETDKTALIKLSNTRTAIEPKMLEWVSFKNSKLDAIKKQSDADLLKLEVLSLEWKQQYDNIYKKAKNILEHYKDKRFYDKCA